MGHEEIGGGEEDFRAGSGLQIPSTWLVVAHVQHQELHRFLPCRKSMTSSPKYLVISVQLVHKFSWNYWSIIFARHSAQATWSTWTILKSIFHFNMKFYFWWTSCWIISNNLKIFSGEEVRSPLPKQSKQTVKCLRTLCTLACRGFFWSDLWRCSAGTNTWLSQRPSMFPHVLLWSNCLSRCTRHISPTSLCFLLL